ncbi:response regulator transcription factor [Mycolicibacterium austroafricanum]|uniref:Response regulator transcription factor n=1 Tax=Mycolicibacterium austroafricanum TaxID=39687 RepID=A0ABT8H9T6_MYCAO|nr:MULTISPECIES: response regulator transcription factor [Mycolicibacterium]MDN4517295.1 response regulator transcription factor [Mycolicibacterium austroafricanum]UJL30667.1 response regulator transcription factor [Mycolicibacterium vanbaalenii]WND56226.1 response regulator transcription factor [Mycolicibacterium vanbaalenii]
MNPTFAPAGGASHAGQDHATVGLVLVDDHAILRQGLRSVLEREEDLAILGEASSEPEAEAVVRATQPDVVLLDLKLSTGSDFEGLSLCARLSASHPGIGLLILTTFLDEDLVVRAVHAGARGYVVKDVDTTELIRAIRIIATGGSAFDPRSAAVVVRSLSGRSEPHQQLTDREMEVLRLLAAGLSNNKIGEKLYISSTTAKFHVSNIMRKLGVSGRAEAVYAASKRGLI